MEALPLDGERLADNNSGVIGAEVVEWKIRVINMEGTPNAGHWLENALESDPDIEVTSLFFPQSESFETSRQIPFTVDADGRKIYNIAHPIKGYPRTLQDMLNYDVIINSDIFKEAFTHEQLDLTVALVEEHSGGIVMVGGSTAFGAGHYDETVIDKLMPVDVYGNEGIKWSSFKLQVPDEMFDHPVMQLGTTREETARIWQERFPGFSGLNTVNRAKPGARVLAFNASQSNKYGPLVVFSLQDQGEWTFTASLPRPGLDPVFSHALVNVIPDTREFASTAANRELMAELARLGGGKLLEGDPGTWLIAVDPRGSRIIEYGRRAVWDRWWVMSLLLVLLTLEWGLRRRWIGGGVV